MIPWDCGPPGSSVHGISQARILGSVALLITGSQSGTSLPGFVRKLLVETQEHMMALLVWLGFLFYFALHHGVVRSRLSKTEKGEAPL